MNKEIKPSQYMFLIIGFITSSILLISFLEAKNDSWMIPVLSFVVIVPLILCYTWINKRFPGKNLMEIHDMVYGKVLGKVVSLLYLFYFWSLLSFNLRDVGIFYTGFVMGETPMVFFLISMALCCAYAVHKGIPTIARISFVFVVFVLVTVASTFLLLIGKMDFRNFLPVLNEPAASIYHSVQTMATLPYGEIVTFIVIAPFVKDQKMLTKNAIGGMAVAAGIFLAIIVRNIAVLGASSMLLSQSSFEVVRLINVGDFFSRVEILVALNNTSMMFVKISVLYYVTVKCTAQLLKLKTYGPLIVPVGIFSIIYAMIAQSSEIAHREIWGLHYASFFELFFVVIFPILTMVLTRLRRLRTSDNLEQDSLSGE